MPVSAQQITDDSEIVLTEVNGTSDEQISDAVLSEAQLADSDTSTADGTDITDVSDNSAVSDTTETPDSTDTEESSLFPGLPENYVLSDKQMEKKRILSEHVAEISSIAMANVESGDNSESEYYASGEVVYLTDSEEDALIVAAAFGGTLDSYFSGVAVIKLPAERTVADAVTAAANSTVRLPAVWPNYCVYTDATYNDPAMAETNSNYQWYHEALGDTYVWDAGYAGQGVKIGIIDTGVHSNHEDLKDRIKQNVSTAGDSITNVTTDPGGHGTHVSGIAAATANNSKGGAGVAPRADLYVYSVMDSDGKMYTAAIMRAIKESVNDGMDVVNMSLGSQFYNGDYCEVLQNAYKAGVAVFASAGNGCTNTFNYPASYPNVCSIGALQQDNSKTIFSNYNTAVDLSFPGQDIYSTYNGGNSSYTFMDGTSMASPAATGAAAVILSGADQIKELKGKEKGPKRVDALISVMKKNAIKSSSSGTGAGMTYLPKVFGITPDRADVQPATPTFSLPNKTVINAATTNLKITSATTTGVTIYYNIYGKTPTFKNGLITNGSTYSSSGITIGNAQSVTVKAIAVNIATGKVSKVATATYTFKPAPTSLSVTSANGVTKVPLGKSLSLKATVVPSYAVASKTTWTVSPADQGVTVDAKGKVTASKTAAAGTYTITATDSTSSAKGSISITVIAASTVKSVAFSKDVKAITLARNETKDLSAGLIVTKLDGSAGTASDVIWFSSNSSVATVSAAGVVTGKTAGTVNITALSNDGSNKSAVCKVTVTRPVTSISISGFSKVAAGKTITLTATVRPGTATNKKLEWSVDGTGLTVKNGKVTASKTANGKYTVTVKALDGSNVTATKEITVVPEAIQSITLPQKSLNLFATAGNFSAPTQTTLVPTIKGGDATAITYSSSAPGIATVDANGVVRAKSSGKTVITCAAADGSGKKATCTVTVGVPMSSLNIYSAATTKDEDDQNTAYLSVGTSLKLTTACGTSFGKPQNANVIWSVKSGSEDKISISKSGVVKALSVGSSATSSTNYVSAYVTAKAADGSGATAEFKLTILRKIKSYGLERSSYNFYPYVVYDNGEYDYCVPFTFTVSSPKGIVTSTTGYNDYGEHYFYVAPSKPTTSRIYDAIYYVKSSEYVKASVKVKILTGANKTVSGSCKVGLSADGIPFSVK